MSARGRSGFTLLEVLLAASLSAILGLAIAQVMFVSERAQRNFRARGTRRALEGAVLGRIEGDLRALAPPGGVHASGLLLEMPTGATMSGEELLDPALRSAARADAAAPPIDGRDRLTLSLWPAVHPFGLASPAGWGCLRQVIYRIDDDPNTPERGLVREVLAVRDPPPGEAAPPLEELLPEAVGLELRCWDGQAWQRTWDSGTLLVVPRLVELRLAVARQGKVELWTVEVAPPVGLIGAPVEATQ